LSQTFGRDPKPLANRRQQCVGLVRTQDVVIDLVRNSATEENIDSRAGL
jgi:hypothetical protein